MVKGTLSDNGKSYLYVCPIKNVCIEDDDECVVDYIICKVKVIDAGEYQCLCVIESLINDYKDHYFPLYKEGKSFYIDNDYLFEIKKKAGGPF